jgi:hypothetical protein
MKTVIDFALERDDMKDEILEHIRKKVNSGEV